MEQTNLSLAGISFGLFVTLSSWVRYFIIWADMDKAVFFGLMGIMIIAISWNYAGRVSLSKRIDKIEITLTSVEEWLVDKSNERKR
jgi:tetrahydromethanopterin S-methyltransferase subunit E